MGREGKAREEVGDAVNAPQLDDIIRESLDRFYDDITREAWHRRERELVSLYVIGHLLDFVGREEVLADRTQIGIEVAVPQHVTSRRHDPDVCKDIVIWPKPRMSCWGSDGKVCHHPLAVMEWKSLNRADNAAARHRKMSEHAADIDWLREASEKAPGFIGYAVLISQDSHSLSLACAHVCAGKVLHQWLTRPE